MFINVKKLNSKAKLPERATATSAGAASVRLHR